MVSQSVLTSNDVIERLERNDLSLVLQSRARSLPGYLFGTVEYEALSFVDPASDTDREFGIDVFASREDAAKGVRNGPDSTSGDNGVTWTLIAPEHRGDKFDWLAAKVYENVALYWSSAHKRTDARWHQVDEALGELARAVAARE
jgi:hypothetical protein